MTKEKIISLVFLQNFCIMEFEKYNPDQYFFTLKSEAFQNTFKGIHISKGRKIYQFGKNY